MRHSRLVKQGVGFRARAAVVLGLALMLLGAGTGGSAFAHVKNDETQFPDIDTSEARFEIVLLAAAGIIPETPVFEPDKPLSRYELATWAALANNLAERDEFPELDALAQAALASGLISSLDGNATLGELNQVLFGGSLAVPDEERVPSKEEAATIVANHLSAPIEGGTLLERQGIEEGPVGEVVAVVKRPTPNRKDAYYITIGETTLPAHEHIRVAGGPTDLPLWEGAEVARTFLEDAGEWREWSYMEAARSAPVPARPAGEAPAAVSARAKDGGSNVLFYVLVAAAAILALLLFASRPRRE